MPVSQGWLKSFIRSPTGPLTIHFWGPMANWGFVLSVCYFVTIKQGLVDLKKSPTYISKKMTGGITYILIMSIVLCMYSLLFMRFAWMVQPRNILLFACHFCNEGVQCTLLGKRIKYDMEQKRKGLKVED